MADNIVREVIEKTIKDTIQKTIKDTIEKTVRESVGDAIRLSIEKSIREQIQKGLVNTTDAILNKNVEDILKNSLKNNISVVEDAVKANPRINSLLQGGLLDAGSLKSKIENSISSSIPSSSVDDLATLAKREGKDMAKLPDDIISKGEDLRKGVGEDKIGGDINKIIDEPKVADDIADDVKFNEKTSDPNVSKKQSEDFVKKNGNNKYKIGGTLLLGSALAAYVLIRNNKDTAPRGIKKIEKTGDKELKITYDGDKIDFCSGDDLVVNITQGKVTPNINGSYTSYEVLSNNMVKLTTNVSISTYPEVEAPSGSSYGDIKAKRSFTGGLKCTVVGAIRDVINTVTDVTGIDKLLDSIKKFFKKAWPWAVGIIIGLIVLSIIMKKL